MAKLNDVLKTMFTQTGVNVSDAAISKIIEADALKSLDVDDAVVTTLTIPRFTLDAAKNNPDLIKHFKGITLNPINEEVARIAQEEGLSESDIEELTKESNSYKKLPLLLNKLKTTLESKSGKVKVDKTQLEKDVERLNQEIVKTKDAYEKTLAQKDANFENERLNMEVNFSYTPFLSQMDKSRDGDINLTMAQAYVNKALNRDRLKVAKKDGQLMVVNHEGGDHYIDNKKVSFSDFVAKVLANNKLLTASSSTPATPARRQAKSNESGLNVSGYVNAVEKELESA